MHMQRKWLCPQPSVLELSSQFHFTALDSKFNLQLRLIRRLCVWLIIWTRFVPVAIFVSLELHALGQAEWVHASCSTSVPGRYVIGSRRIGGELLFWSAPNQTSYHLYPKDYLSVNDKYHLLMQPDCNLIYLRFFSASSERITEALTPNGTSNNYSLSMKSDGNLVIYNFTGGYQCQSAIWPQFFFPCYGQGHRNSSFLLVAGDGRYDFYNTNTTLRQPSYTTASMPH